MLQINHPLRPKPVYQHISAVKSLQEIDIQYTLKEQIYYALESPPTLKSAAFCLCSPGLTRGLSWWLSSRESTYVQGLQEPWVPPLGQKEPLEKEMAAHSSFLTWEILWPEEPGRLRSAGSQRVRYN